MLGRKKGVQVFAALPRVWHEKELPEIQGMVEGIASLSPSGFTAGTLGSLGLLRSLGATVVHGDYPLNIFNRQGIYYLLEQGVSSYSLSLELNMQEIGLLRQPSPKGGMCCPWMASPDGFRALCF